ncbi:MAG: hypothetical protein H6865_06540 [Rhodospirillales bacterium]|nr:hypothetical protein [Alphaproteobacteria bacterium]MCB9987278.1 hypothetical protein [Rhodospirillales bacterium]USO07865.1 MAG: hypothetical protein H6866_01160 [Rhodospirillales bacterium]
MDITTDRRGFLKGVASAAANAVFDRYNAVRAILSDNVAATLADRLDPAHLDDYFSLFEYAASGIMSPFDGEYFFEPRYFLPVGKATLDDLPKYTQKTLRSIYRDAVHALRGEVRQLAHLLKYKDDLAPIIAMMRAHTLAYATAQNYASPEGAARQIEKQLDTLGSQEKIHALMTRLLSDYAKTLAQVGAHLTPQSRTRLAGTPLLQFPEAGLDIPYLFPLDKLPLIAEAIAFEDNGHFLDIMDVPETWRNLFTALSRTDTAKNRLAQRCLTWESTYYDRALMHRAGLTETHLRAGLHAVLQEKMEDKAFELELANEAFEHLLHGSGLPPARMEEPLQKLERMIDDGHLRVRSLPYTGTQSGFALDMTPETDDPYLGAAMDDVADTIATAIQAYAHVMERTQAHEIRIAVQNDDYQSLPFLETMARRTQYTATHGSFSGQLQRLAGKLQDFTQLETLARALRPTLKI